MTTVYVILAAALWWSVFCRLIRINRQTRPAVRLAFVASGITTTCAIFSVVFWGHHPAWPDLLMLASILAVNLSTAYYWRDTVPDVYRCRS